MKRFLLLLAVLLCGPLARAQFPGASVTAHNPYYRVISMTEDQDGYLWFGTDGNGLFRYDGSTYLKFAQAQGEGSILSGHVSALLSASDGTLWVGTQKGVCKLDRSGKRFVTYTIEDTNNYVWSIREDPFSHIYLTTQNSLFLLDEENQSFKKVLSFKEGGYTLILSDREAIWVIYRNSIEKYDLKYRLWRSYTVPSVLRKAVYDGGKYIYLYTQQGFVCFDTRRGECAEAPAALRAWKGHGLSALEEFGTDGMVLVDGTTHSFFDFKTGRLLHQADRDFPFDVPREEAMLIRFYRGPSGRTWESYDNGQFFCLDTDTANPYRQLSREFAGTTVQEMASDGYRLWFIDKGSTLVSYNLSTREVQRESIGHILGNPLDKQYYFLYWSATESRLFLYTSYTIHELAVSATGQVKKVRSFSKKPDSSISAIAVDRNHTLWVGSRDYPDLYHVSLANPRETELRLKHIGTKAKRVYASALCPLANGDLAVGYTDIGLAILDGHTQEPRFVTLSEREKQMYIHSLYEDGEGNIWAGTSDVGLFIYSASTGEVRQPARFVGKNIRSLSADMYGHVLFMNESTLYRHDPATDQFQTMWKPAGKAHDKYGRVFPQEDGYLLINSGRQFISLDTRPTRRRILPETFRVILTNKDDSLLDVLSAPSRQGIKLLPEQKNIGFTVSAPNFLHEPLLYRYRIHGQTKDWQSSFNNPVIPLNTLSYGKHKTELQISTIDGRVQSPVQLFTLEVKRPLLITYGAIILYILLFILCVALGVRAAVRAGKKRLENERIRQEKEFQEKMNEANVDFFANMSHEFRTPLSIISAALTTLGDDKGLSPSQERLLRIMRRNSDRMLKLVSQMLDFNKLEHNKLPLSVSLVDAHSSIRDIVEVFGVGVEQKEISLTLEGADQPLLTWLDSDKFEKILYNLLSNAVKFTPFKGSIKVRSSVCGNVSALFPGEKVREGEYLVVEVADSGIGIPQESMSVIFERFGQAFPSQKNGGTGIGLYFAKAMVELHHGFIKAANNGGAVFTFALPMEADAYSEKERKPHEEAPRVLDGKQYLSEYTTPTPKARTDIKVLVIDDDYEVIYFLKSLLSAEYKVVTCFDAMSGYKLIESEQPDIIISDIMMYEMDGLQLCKMVKEDINICHIPFILLTAKSTVADQVEGLNAGADAYILKPFEPHYLMAMVGSLLRNRVAARNLMENSTKVSRKLGESVSERDKKLLEKIYRLFEENLSNTDVNAADFASECDISRTKFFYKVKGLTGMTPTEFFRVYRLNRALELIKADKYKISSIADMCGFSSASHFALSFKKHFGMLPSEYLDQ